MFDVNKFFDAKRIINEHTVETDATGCDRNEKYYKDDKFPEPDTKNTEIIPLFSVPLLLTNLNDKYIRLMESVVEGESKNQQGNVMIHSGRGCYQSNEDLHKRYDNVKTIVSKIEEIILDNFNLDLEVRDCWLNVNGPGGFNYEHNHGGIFSGCFYISIPEDSSSDLVLHNPAPRSESSPVIPKVNERYMFITPEAGDLVIFPSWLTHRVEPNKSQQNRISISFNAFLK